MKKKSMRKRVTRPFLAGRVKKKSSWSIEDQGFFRETALAEAAAKTSWNVNSSWNVEGRLSWRSC